MLEFFLNLLEKSKYSLRSFFEMPSHNTKIVQSFIFKEKRTSRSKEIVYNCKVWIFLCLKSAIYEKKKRGSMQGQRGDALRNL